MYDDLLWRLRQANPYHLLGAVLGIALCVSLFIVLESESMYTPLALISLVQSASVRSAPSIGLWHRYQEQWAWNMWSSMAMLVLSVFAVNLEIMDHMVTWAALLDLVSYAATIAAAATGTGYIACVLQRYERAL